MLSRLCLFSSVITCRWVWRFFFFFKQKTAYDMGVNFFDSAEAYADGKAEIVMGNIFKKLGWSREGIVVSRKVFWGGDGPNDKALSRRHMFAACRKSLKRLPLHYLQLLSRPR